MGEHSACVCASTVLLWKEWVPFILLMILVLFVSWKCINNVVRKLFVVCTGWSKSLCVHDDWSTESYK
jgi:L-lactate permease